MYELSIQVNLSGLSFFVLNSTDATIEFLESVNFDKKQTPQNLLDQLIHSFNSIKELQKEIEQLKKLLLKKDLDAMIQDSYLEVAAEDLGYKSVAELKKKLNIER